jgi:hypothetical protein
MRAEKPFPDTVYWVGLVCGLGMIFTESHRILKAKRAEARKDATPEDGR